MPMAGRMGQRAWLLPVLLCGFVAARGVEAAYLVHIADPLTIDEQGRKWTQGRPDVQNPYVVGRWVRGDEHYDRQKLIEHLLNAHDTAIWVVGTRRMGKTSLLRQIEHVTMRSEERRV